MPRAPSVCQRAAHTLGSSNRQYIWVSDEQLSSAFARFICSTCTHQKRHGSHVPGPLEARRRGVKRRMTVASASPQVEASPPFGLTLGDLFGSQRRREPSWRYEPPSNSFTLDSHSKKRTVHPFRNLESFFAPPKQVEVPHTKTADRDVTSAYESPNPTKDKAVPANDLVSQKLAQKPTVVRTVLTEIPQRKEKKLSEEARTWLSPLPRLLDSTVRLPNDSSKIFASLVNGNLALPRLPTAEAVAFVRWLSEVPPKLRGQVRPVYRQLAKQRTTAQYFTRHELPKLSDEQHLDDARISIVLRTVWESFLTSKPRTSARLGTSEIKCLSRIQEVFCSRLCKKTTLDFDDPGQSISQITSMLESPENSHNIVQQTAVLVNCVPQAELLTSIKRLAHELGQDLRDWISVLPYRSAKLKSWLMLMHCLDRKIGVEHDVANWTQLTLKHLAIEGVRFVDIGSTLCRTSSTLEVQYLLYVLPYHETIRETHSLEAHNFVKKYRGYFQGIESDPTLQFAELLHEMHKASIPNHGIAEVLLNRIAQFKNAHFFMGRLLRRLTEKGCKLSNVDFLYAWLTNLLETLHPTEANVHFIMTLQQVSENLAIKRSQEESTSTVGTDVARKPRSLAQIVQRARRMHHMPPLFAVTSIRDLEWMDSELCHELVHQYSFDYTKSCQEIWRSIFPLYKHLIRSSSPLTPRLTRALVRATIVRPFLENRFVSSRRLVWACQIVARVEGEHIAKRLEDVFYVWRGELIRYAKKKFVDAGGHPQDKAHVNTMKKLGLI